MGRPPKTINQIIKGKKSITPETAIQLGLAFGTSAELWWNLETRYQLRKALEAWERLGL
jgi:HTH-type transcriptional regulator/antitoxin HigA